MKQLGRDNLGQTCIYQLLLTSTFLYSNIEILPFEDEDGDLRDREDIGFRQEAMNEKNHVTWNTERRCFLNAEAAER